jgi:branched-chain amino acid transport system substrate-binding protein
MRDAGLQSAFIGSDALATPQFAEAAGSSADGAVAFVPHDAARMLGESAAHARFAPHPASEPFLSAFAAVEAWADAARRAQTLAAPAVAETLQRASLDTVLGPLSFDAEGDANIPDYDLVWWQDGAWRRKPLQAGRNG